MDPDIQAFINHIPYDKKYVHTLLKIDSYNEIIKNLGHFILNRSTTLWSKNTPEMQELLDFIDGNGFEVYRPKKIIIWDNYPIKIIPIYSEEKNEKEVQPTFTEYVSFEETSVSYTSSAASEDYVPQHQKLYLPRPLRILSPRCMELLRMVPTRRGRSTSLPRPP